VRLPRSVQEIANVIGHERALYLIGQLPRCVRRDTRYPNATQSEVVLYVPSIARLTMHHPLVAIIGWNDATKLAKHFGGEILRPANCREIYRNYRDRMIDNFLREGMNVAQVAALVGVSDRHVRGIQAEIPREESPIAANDNAPTNRRARAANGTSRRLRG
jgi:hypothetical protein